MHETEKDKKSHLNEVASRLLPLLRAYEKETFSEGEAETWEQINRRIETQEQHVLRRRILLYAVSAAACLLLLVGGFSLWLFADAADNETLVAVVDRFPIPTPSNTGILLVTSSEQKLNVEDDTNVTYNPDGSITVNSETVDQPAAEKKVETTYNQLLVPKGKRTHIYFADGTCIYVNSGTRVVYPAVFAADKREIYVDGEIYLDVKRDESRPFYVKTDQMEVRVLGTSFGVCAYKEDKEASVVLVSGKVEVETTRKEKATLAPNELFSMKKTGVSIRKVDASEYVCWTQNMMIFNQEPLNNVLTRLSRYYGKNIHYNPDINRLTISGKLDLRDDLTDVMEIVTAVAPVTFSDSEAGMVVKSVK